MKLRRLLLAAALVLAPACQSGSDEDPAPQAEPKPDLPPDGTGAIARLYDDRLAPLG